ncbi:hypothetical protein C2S53_014659 [Perilla frutescens var. hirtella]|uniref:Uncharacterized protein n=1 Tax=Perilla frutescens var. hirtella TaxID=608512 RepID=A0AAD4P275_PERFH|nr:hypothetical protein C2S53_014659 [Perilla frutescens var. hirtella]
MRSIEVTKNRPQGVAYLANPPPRCSKIFQRASVATLKSGIAKPASFLNRSATTSLPRPHLSSNSVASPLRQLSLSLAPSELRAMVSMMPLHSAVADARITSCLSSSSRSCAISQGTFCCTSPDL